MALEKGCCGPLEQGQQGALALPKQTRRRCRLPVTPHQGSEGKVLPGTAAPSLANVPHKHQFDLGREEGHAETNAGPRNVTRIPPGNYSVV